VTEFVPNVSINTLLQQGDAGPDETFPLCILTSLKRGVNQTQRLKDFCPVCDGIRPERFPLTPCFSRVMSAPMKRWNRLSGFILAPFQPVALHEQFEFFSKAPPSMVLLLVCNVPGDLRGTRV
jgi:hypothetical protein